MIKSTVSYYLWSTTDDINKRSGKDSKFLKQPQIICITCVYQIILKVLIRRLNELARDQRQLPDLYS